MYRQDLIRYIQRNINDGAPRREWMNQNQIEKVLEGSLTAIMELVANGEDIVFAEFGSFSRKVYHGRLNHHPETGEMSVTKSRYIPSFKPSKAWKQLVMNTEEYEEE